MCPSPVLPSLWDHLYLLSATLHCTKSFNWLHLKCTFIIKNHEFSPRTRLLMRTKSSRILLMLTRWREGGAIQIIQFWRRGCSGAEWQEEERCVRQIWWGGAQDQQWGWRWRWPTASSSSWSSPPSSSSWSFPESHSGYTFHGDPKQTFQQFFGTSNPFESFFNMPGMGSNPHQVAQA